MRFKIYIGSRYYIYKMKNYEIIDNDLMQYSMNNINLSHKYKHIIYHIIDGRNNNLHISVAN